MNTPSKTLATAAPPDPVDRELAPLLSEPLAGAFAAATVPAGVRPRLLDRLAASRQASAGMVTRRRARLAPQLLAPGVRSTALYAHDPSVPLRPGEPLRSTVVELDAGAVWAGPAADPHREWLVLQGSLRIGDVTLGERDYHVLPAGVAQPALASDGGARVFLREAIVPAGASEPITVRDDEAGWPDFAPGIRRRVLWQHAGQAALLYWADAGARVPDHGHGHDEECLMVQGDLFLDDVLLQAGDYQLAPAGTGHQVTETDTGVVIYAHGDLAMQFVG